MCASDLWEKSEAYYMGLLFNKEKEKRVKMIQRQNMLTSFFDLKQIVLMRIMISLVMSW